MKLSDVEYPAKFSSWKDALPWIAILKADVAESNQGDYKNNKITFVLKFIYIPEKQYFSNINHCTEEYFLQLVES